MYWNGLNLDHVICFANDADGNGGVYALCANDIKRHVLRPQDARQLERDQDRNPQGLSAIDWITEEVNKVLKR